MDKSNEEKNQVKKEINFEYQQFLNNFYKVDKASIKKWLDEKFSHYFYRQLGEICVDKDQAVPRDQTQKELIEDSLCSICLGIVRLPGKMCNNCSKVFCEICVSKISGYAAGQPMALDNIGNQSEDI